MIKAIGLRLFPKALGDNKGVTSLEYAVLGVFLVVAIIAAVTGLQEKLSTALVTTIGDSI